MLLAAAACVLLHAAMRFLLFSQHSTNMHTHHGHCHGHCVGIRAARKRTVIPLTHTRRPPRLQAGCLTFFQHGSEFVSDNGLANAEVSDKLTWQSQPGCVTHTATLLALLLMFRGAWVMHTKFELDL